MNEARSLQDLIQIGLEMGLYNRAIAGVTYLRRGESHKFFAHVDGGLAGYPKGPNNQPLAYREICPDSIFDIASITKTLITLAWHAYQGKGLLRYKGKVVDNETLIAEILGMRGPFVEKLQVKHLHSFYAKFLAFDEIHPTKDVILQGFENLKCKLLFGGLKSEPGTEWKYANPHTILLGLLLEKLTGKTLFECVKSMILGPLKMHSTVVNPGWKMNLVVKSDPQTPPGTLNDPTARAVLSECGRLAGSAGLFSSANDLLILLQMLLNGGLHEGKQIIAPSIVQNLHIGMTNQFGNGIGRWEVFRKNLEDVSIQDESGRFKLGHTGAIIVELPHYNLAYTVLTDLLMIPRSAEELRAARAQSYKLFAAVSRHAHLESMS